VSASRLPFVLSASPLSQRFCSCLAERLGVEPDYLNLPALRRLPLRALVSELRRYEGRPCLLAFEDPASSAVQPVLHCLAVFAGPSSIEIVDSGGSATPISLRRLPAELADLAGGTAEGMLAALAARREVARLRSLPRANTPRGRTGRALYLNANLWLGLKAGGSVGHVAGVVNGLCELGYEVDLFSVAEPVLVSPKVRYRQLEPPSVLGLPLEVNFPRFQRSAIRQVVAAAKPPYDFVYHRLSAATFAGVELARRLGTPLVLEYNGSEVWIARNWGRPLRYERYALAAEEASLEHAHLVVTVSRALRDELLGRGVEPERVVWYPNCVDERLYDPARFDADAIAALRARYGLPPDAVVVGFIGTFGRWHGAEVLARAIVELAADREWLERQRVRFLLVGDGLRMPEVKMILAGLVEAGVVALPGLVPQVEGPAHLAACDILVSPHVPNDDGSPFFGSPTKLFEYMAMGKAIVASRLDQIAEVLAPSLDASTLPESEPGSASAELALLTTPGSEGELIRGLRFLVEYRAWRHALGSNVRREALARYTWRRHVEAILEGVARVPG
jgi:glycosyltransferase involved in cell wall biosynthesis